MLMYHRMTLKEIRERAYKELTQEEAVRIKETTGIDVTKGIGVEDGYYDERTGDEQKDRESKIKNQKYIASKTRKDIVEIGSIYNYIDTDVTDVSKGFKPRPVLVVGKYDKNMSDVKVIPFFSDANDNLSKFDEESKDYIITIDPTKDGEENVKKLGLRTRYEEKDGQISYKKKKPGDPYISHLDVRKVKPVNALFLDIVRGGSLEEVMPNKYELVMQKYALYLSNELEDVLQNEKFFSIKKLNTYIKRLENTIEIIKATIEKRKQDIEKGVKNILRPNNDKNNWKKSAENNDDKEK